MQTPNAPHNTSFASLINCIGLYVTNLILSVITYKDTEKCKYLGIISPYYALSNL